MRPLKESREPASGSSRPNRSPLRNERCFSWAWRGRRRRAHAWPRRSRMSGITSKRAAAGLNSAVPHPMPMRPACPYMHCTPPVCQRPMRRIEKAWSSCSRRNIPTGLGSSSPIPFQFSVTSKVDFPSAGTNGFPLREPVGRPWPLRSHFLTGRTSHKKAPETEKIFLFCVRWGKLPSSQRRAMLWPFPWLEDKFHTQLNTPRASRSQHRVASEYVRCLRHRRELARTAVARRGQVQVCVRGSVDVGMVEDVGELAAELGRELLVEFLSFAYSYIGAPVTWAAKQVSGRVPKRSQSGRSQYRFSLRPTSER